MGKLVSLVKSAPGVSDAQFAAYWRDRLLPEFLALEYCRRHAIKIIHHHALRPEVREDDDRLRPEWAGAATCYFDAEDVETLLDDPEFKALWARHAAVVSQATHLPVHEIWMYNRDTSHLPVKMFAFFKRKPGWTRADVQKYYTGTHAEVGASINKNRTVRYIQNHVLENYKNPDAAYDFDAGPEIWFKSVAVAQDLFNDAPAMEVLGRDEENFCLREQSIHFLTDEQTMFDRATAPA